MTVDEAIQALDEAIEGYLVSDKGSPRHRKSNIVKAREQLIRVVREDAVQAFAETIRRSLTGGL